MGDNLLVMTVFLIFKHRGRLSAHSFASNRQLALLESAVEGNYFSTKDCTGSEDGSRNSPLRSIHAIEQATMPCISRKRKHLHFTINSS